MNYGHFYVSQLLTYELKNLKSIKWPYIAHFSSKWKKVTLFSSTLKVGEKSCSIFVWAKITEILPITFSKEKMLNNQKGKKGVGSELVEGVNLEV